MTNQTTSDIKTFLVSIQYRERPLFYDVMVLASNAHDAVAIGRTMFEQKFTDRCVFEEAKVELADKQHPVRNDCYIIGDKHE